MILRLVFSWRIMAFSERRRRRENSHQRSPEHLIRIITCVFSIVASNCLNLGKSILSSILLTGYYTTNTVHARRPGEYNRFLKAGKVHGLSKPGLKMLDIQRRLAETEIKIRWSGCSFLKILPKINNKAGTCQLSHK